jgi:hypothetical protein
MLCADLVSVAWRESGGPTQQAVANLEDISASGACLQLDDPIPLNTVVRITHTRGELVGRVRYCVYREVGYFLGIRFEPGTRWSRKDYCPLHLFDPRRLLALQAEAQAAE